MNSPTNMPGQFRTVACSMFSAVQCTLRKRWNNFRTLKNSNGGIGKIITSEEIRIGQTKVVKSRTREMILNREKNSY